MAITWKQIYKEGDYPTFTALNLSATSGGILVAGTWTGIPSPIGDYSSILGDLFCGNVGANTGRFRVGSNDNAGFLQWNRYWDGSASQQFDTSKPSWSWQMRGDIDSTFIERSPAGSTTMTTLFSVSSTGVVNLPNLTASQAVMTDASNNLVSVDYLDQAVKTTSSPTLSALAVSNADTTKAYLTIENTSSTSARYPAFVLDMYGGSTADGLCYINFRKAGGTKAVPSIADTGGRIGEILFQAHDGTAFRSNASIRVYTESTFDSTHRESNIRFYTATGEGAISERMRLSSSGLLLVGKTSGTELIESAGKVRADTAFNLNGTDGVTQAASAGTVADPTAIAGGIVTAQTQVTYIADGAHSLAGITSITTVNGRITAMA
jgi:hypothetical protein